MGASVRGALSILGKFVKKVKKFEEEEEEFYHEPHERHEPALRGLYPKPKKTLRAIKYFLGLRKRFRTKALRLCEKSSPSSSLFEWLVRFVVNLFFFPPKKNRCLDRQRLVGWFV